MLIENGRAAGIEGLATASGKKLTVRARATVLACGTAMTPVLLMQQGLDKGLPHVGKHLSIHPATMVSALFDEEIKGYNAIPQGYCVDEFQREEGILLLGASAPVDVGSVQWTFVGDRLMRAHGSYDRVASFGVMVEDRSVGSVRPGPRGRPLVTYTLGPLERERLAARDRDHGAHLPRRRRARGLSDAARAPPHPRPRGISRDLREAKTSAGDWSLTAFHPLGTCRMATSRGARRGVAEPRGVRHRGPLHRRRERGAELDRGEPSA